MRQTQVITTIIISIACIVGGLFVLLSNYRSRPNRIVFWLTLFTAFSLPIQSILEYADPSRVVLWGRLDASSTIILDALTLLLVCNFPRRLFKWKTEWTYGALSIALALISFSPLVITSGFSNGQTVQLATGPFMPLFYIVDALYMALILPALLVQYRRGRKMDRLRIKYLLLGIGSIALMISIVGLWLPLLFHVYQAVDYIPFVILLGASFIAYDVIALRLLSIRLVVARSVAYVLLLVFLAISYYFLALWVGDHIFGIIKITEVGQIYQVVVALMLVFLFQPVRFFFEKLTNQLFYKDHYDTQKVINGFSKILVSERDLESLLEHSLSFICRQLRIKSGHIVVYDKTEIIAAAQYNTKPLNNTMTGFNTTDDTVTVSDYLADEDPKRKLMSKTNISVVTQLISQKKRIGTLLLGDKLSGDIYSGQDMSTLEIISQELAVAVQNARAYRELQDAQTQLKRTDEMKSEFIALTSHNLRTPTTTVRGIAEMLSTAETRQERDKYIAMLSEVSEDLGGLVEELLVINTLEAGGQYESFEIIDIDDLLRLSTAQTEAAAKTKGLSFALTFENSGLQVRASRPHLGMAIRSLLDNAVKFTKAGHITVTVAKHESQCVITIADTGVGVGKRELKSLYTKFHRGTDYHQYDYSGIGVGLYLTKLVVEEHGGQIAIESRLRRGTIVTVRLPLAKE